MPIGPDQTLSHYRLIEKIGEGGMGVVWKAQDQVLGRTVAIKVLPADVAGDEKRRRMFLDEARLASSISDAHIAQVHELGREGGLDFIVMEYIDGKPLHRILHGRPLPADKVAGLGQQVAQALARAHRRHLLHRDLKPSNILITPDGDAKVVDFGLATLFGRREATLASIDASLGTTATLGAPDGGEGEDEVAGRAGTLPYMSPEQARGETLDARSDIFSLGVVLYEMTTGQRPFTGRTNVALLKEIVRGRFRSPHEISSKV
ncbi:MAG TPA: serine/threonine-protein kinase, partial [Candidatus Polarisedimenticolia bacterium]|nr:serine/threonine-protein kinase [Candidatus Polarisedimenticolia bacterium]